MLIGDPVPSSPSGGYLEADPSIAHGQSILQGCCRWGGDEYSVHHAGNEAVRRSGLSSHKMLASLADNNCQPGKSFLHPLAERRVTVAASRPVSWPHYAGNTRGTYLQGAKGAESTDVADLVIVFENIMMTVIRPKFPYSISMSRNDLLSSPSLPPDREAGHGYTILHWLIGCSKCWFSGRIYAGNTRYIEQ